MTQDILELADEYAHCYAFVGDETMSIKRKQLHDAIATIQAQESEKWQARVADLEGALIDISKLDYTRAAVNHCAYEAHRIASQVLANKSDKHTLYTNADKDRPDSICDRNGDVVLGLCKKVALESLSITQPELTELRGVVANATEYQEKLLEELIDLREVVRKAAEQKPIAIINKGAASELWLPQGMKIYAAPQMQKEGYDLFPVEPSDKMKDAGYAQSNDESKVMCGLIYKAMIAASKEEKR